MKKTHQTKGTLYIVSTSIGNKKDITIRATEVLQNCDIIVGEEIKEASRVLMHLNLSKPIELLNEHNETEKVGELIDLIESGKSIALISDCGTPIFADPGIELLRAAINKKLDIQVIPGVSSIMTAVIRSGFDLKRFFYAGFLHRNSKERIKEIQDLSYFPYTIVVMDTPYRLKVLLEDFSEVMPFRKAYIGMNLTMQSETHHYGTFSELFEKFKSTRTRNEYVLVIEGNLVGNLNAIQNTFEIENELQTNTTLSKDDKFAHLNEKDTLSIDDEDKDTNLEFDNKLSDNDETNEKFELIERDEDLILIDESKLKGNVEQKYAIGSRNREDNRRQGEINEDKSDSRGSHRGNSHHGDPRGESRREDLRDRYRRDDDRQGSSRRSDSNRGGNERRSNNFRDGYRKKNEEYRKVNRPRREEEVGSSRKFDDSRDSSRGRNDDFRRNERQRDSDYGKDESNKRDNFNKDNNRSLRGRFEKRLRRQKDVGANQQKNYNQKKERTNQSDKFEPKEQEGKIYYNDLYPSRKSNRNNRSSNPRRSSNKSSQSGKGRRGKKDK